VHLQAVLVFYIKYEQQEQISAQKFSWIKTIKQLVSYCLCPNIASQCTTSTCQSILFSQLGSQYNQQCISEVECNYTICVTLYGMLDNKNLQIYTDNVVTCNIIKQYVAFLWQHLNYKIFCLYAKKSSNWKPCNWRKQSNDGNAETVKCGNQLFLYIIFPLL